MNIVLASASPRRAKLLKQINLTFTVDPSALSEETNGISEPDKLVEYLAKLKGEDVAKRHSSTLVIAADTVVSLAGELLGKPKNPAEAFEMLSKLSNRTHQVFTGVYIGVVNHQKNISDNFTFSERTNVTFSTLTEQEINYYISTGSPMDKAGAYGIQDDLGSLFVKKIDGDYYNVVGFPVHSFYQTLKSELPEIHKTLFL